MPTQFTSQILDAANTKFTENVNVVIETEDNFTLANGETFNQLQIVYTINFPSGNDATIIKFTAETLADLTTSSVDGNGVTTCMNREQLTSADVGYPFLSTNTSVVVNTLLKTTIAGGTESTTQPVTDPKISLPASQVNYDRVAVPTIFKAAAISRQNLVVFEENSSGNYSGFVEAHVEAQNSIWTASITVNNVTYIREFPDKDGSLPGKVFVSKYILTDSDDVSIDYDSSYPAEGNTVPIFDDTRDIHLIVSSLVSGHVVEVTAYAEFKVGRDKNAVSIQSNEYRTGTSTDYPAAIANLKLEHNSVTNSDNTKRDVKISWNASSWGTPADITYTLHYREKKEKDGNNDSLDVVTNKTLKWEDHYDLVNYPNKTDLGVLREKVLTNVLLGTIVSAFVVVNLNGVPQPAANVANGVSFRVEGSSLLPGGLQSYPSTRADTAKAYVSLHFAIPTEGVYQHLNQAVLFHKNAPNATQLPGSPSDGTLLFTGHPSAAKTVDATNDMYNVTLTSGTRGTEQKVDYTATTKDAQGDLANLAERFVWVNHPSEVALASGASMSASTTIGGSMSFTFTNISLANGQSHGQAKFELWEQKRGAGTGLVSEPAHAAAAKISDLTATGASHTFNFSAGSGDIVYGNYYYMVCTEIITNYNTVNASSGVVAQGSQAIVQTGLTITSGTRTPFALPSASLAIAKVAGSSKANITLTLDSRSDGVVTVLVIDHKYDGTVSDLLTDASVEPLYMETMRSVNVAAAPGLAQTNVTRQLTNLDLDGSDNYTLTLLVMDNTLNLINSSQSFSGTAQ